MSKALRASLVVLGMVACGHEHGSPSGGQAITYSLTAGSQIVISPPPPIKAPTVVEALLGTFTVVQPAVTPGPNTLLLLSIIRLDFHSSHHTVVGRKGGIEATTSVPLRLGVYAVVSIDGQQLGLNGSGPWDGKSPPVFQGVAMCGGDAVTTCDEIDTTGGYLLILDAAPAS